MKLFIKVGSLFCAMTALAAVAVAGDITGAWHGSAKVDLTKIAQPKTPSQRSAMIAQINKLQKSTATLTVRPNHTFAITVDNDKSIPAHSGTWSIQGNKLILAGKGNVRRGPHNQIFTISADGKSIASQYAGVTFTFKR